MYGGPPPRERAKSAYEWATELYGDTAQLTKVCEECGELIQAVAQHLLALNPEKHPNTDYDPRQTALKVIKEAIQVEIMIGQLRCIFDDQASWSLARAREMSRVWDRLIRDGAEVK